MANPIDLSGVASLEQQVYLAALELHRLELAEDPNGSIDNTQVTYNLEQNQVAINVSLGTSLAIDGSDAVISAVPYLPAA